jgi:hypothetical protein
MSAPSESNGRPSDPLAGEGVLANLPRTRPQRSSARRVAARRANASSGAAASPPRTRKASAGTPAAESSAGASASSKPRVARAPKPKKAAAKARTSKPQTSNARAAAPTPVTEKVPRQGFESDFDRASGPVQPPGGAELVASAAEIVGELAKAGIATGERLLKDVLTRLPLS